MLDAGSPGAAATVGTRIEFGALPDGRIVIRLTSGVLCVELPVDVRFVDGIVANLRAAERAVTGARLALVDAGGRPA